MTDIFQTFNTLGIVVKALGYFVAGSLVKKIGNRGMLIIIAGICAGIPIICQFLPFNYFFLVIVFSATMAMGQIFLLNYLFLITPDKKLPIRICIFSILPVCVAFVLPFLGNLIAVSTFAFNIVVFSAALLTLIILIHLLKSDDEVSKIQITNTSIDD